MSVVDVLVENLVERNGFRLSGTLAIRLVAGGVSINGTLKSTLRDQRKNKDLLNVNIPVDARVKIDDIVIPLPNIP
jgi:tRNA A37 threonylcarbamoyltransferase TsaD